MKSKEIDKWIIEAEENGEVAVDTETSSLDPHQADLIGISLSTSALEKHVIYLSVIIPKNVLIKI